MNWKRISYRLYFISSSTDSNRSYCACLEEHHKYRRHTSLQFSLFESRLRTANRRPSELHHRSKHFDLHQRSECKFQIYITLKAWQIHLFKNDLQTSIKCYFDFQSFNDRSQLWKIIWMKQNVLKGLNLVLEIFSATRLSNTYIYISTLIKVLLW